MIDHQKEIERLYRLDYGRPLEFAARIGAIIFCTLSFYWYSGWQIVFVWLGSFLLGHAMLFSFLRVRAGPASKMELAIGSTLLLYTIAAFLWLPTLLVVQADDVMQIGGIGAIGVTIVIMVRRGDTPLLVVGGQIVFVVAIIVFTLGFYVPTLDDVFAQLTLTAIGFALAAYFTEALLSSRMTRMQSETKARLNAQVEKMATLGRLVGGVAHDFNNLLTVIGGNLDLYDEDNRPKEREKYILEARSAVTQAAAHIEQLMVFSRQSKGDPEIVELSELLLASVESGRLLVPESISIKLVDCGEPIRVKFDRTRATTAILNLIANAKDAMPSGGDIELLYLPIELAEPKSMADGEHLPPGRYAKITVSDTGEGIRSGDIDRVLEPFFTTKPPGEGTGLGLSEVEGFCRSSGGGLALDSGPEGTKVSMFFPTV